MFLSDFLPELTAQKVKRPTRGTWWLIHKQSDTLGGFYHVCKVFTVLF